MDCSKYDNGISDKNSVYNKCDSKVTTDTSKNVFLRFKKFSNKLLFGLAGVLVIGVIIIAIFLVFNNNNSFDKFKEAINENNYMEASKIYHEEIRGNTNDENIIIDFLKSEIENVKKDFDENKSDYNTAITKLDTIENTIERTGLELSEITIAKNEINSLNDSRIAFKKGKEFLDNKNYKDALNELKNVISEDENYSEAQELINRYKKEYKEIILNEAETAANSNDYDKALELFNEALTLIPNDSDLFAKKAIYEELNEEKKEAERKEKMKELENHQEVSVENIITFLDTLDKKYISIIVKNNTNKIIKKYVAGWMGFDESGNPVKTGWLLPDYLKEVYVEADGIQPEMTYGYENCWRISDDDTLEVKQFLACVKMVEYDDGSRWVNPYYDYWVEEYIEKPLH